MPGNKESGEKKVVNAVVEPIKRTVQPETVMKSKTQVLTQIITKRKPKMANEQDDEGPWVCKKCISVGGEVQEFVLYYLYRKHMSDVHDEVFDTRLCKYCGRKCNNHNLMLYHLYTKHALKPPASYNFPKCDKCPFIALSVKRLHKHKQLHDDNEMQCQDCKLAFTSAQTLTSHIRITGHYNKPGRVSYDCQYCTKKLQSAITLFSHIKKSHVVEGKRDGIVCLDEVDIMEYLEEDEDEQGEEEYIIPEIINENSIQKDKVKIISNVKVPPNQQDADSTQQNQMVPLEPSSEAEALNNVASGIATSLNLVDIVVLDENQQYILQQDGQNEQEFIIPELTHGQPFTGQVITTQDNTVIQQGMIQSSAGDIASTDELVMVLTDHDYPDEHEGENQENSNIVVLYSHPVEGQEGQFITSQGNLMVNSQTGMLEIRNGSTISTTTPSQMVVTNSVDTPIESIEMIQREIDSHSSELKQEPFFEEEGKQETHQNPPTAKLQSMPDIQSISEVEPQQIPVETEPENTNLIEEPVQAYEAEEHEESHPEETDVPVDVSAEHPAGKDISEDNVDGSLEVSAEEQMEVEEIEHKTAETEENEEINHQGQSEEHHLEDIETLPPQASAEDEIYNKNTENVQQDEGFDVPPEKSIDLQEATQDHHHDHEVILNNPSFLDNSNGQLPPIQQILDEEIQDGGEPMEVDEKIAEEETEKTLEEKVQIEAKESENVKEENREPEPVDETDNPISQEGVVDEQEEDEDEISPEKPEEEEISPEKSEEDRSKQQHDENEMEDNLSAESTLVQNKPITNPTDINRTILDDWEDDTDSQQSEKNVAESESKDTTTDVSTKDNGIPTAVDNVNKLMDDWDEEEEDEKK